NLPAGNLPHSRSFERCVEVSPVTFCSSDFFYFPTRRLAWRQFIMHTVSFSVHMGGRPASPLRPALHWFLSHFCGALFPVGRAWVVVASLLVYKFGRCACVCAAALSLPRRRLSLFFLSTCVPCVWFICKAPQSVYGLCLVRLPRRQRMRRLCSIERAVI
ncbi:unnamed protein product, partial [Ixodes persulcatus]